MFIWHLSYIPHIRKKAFFKKSLISLFLGCIRGSPSQSGFFWPHLSCVSLVPPWPSLFLSYQTIRKVPTPSALSYPYAFARAILLWWERLSNGHSSPPLLEPKPPPAMWLPLKRLDHSPSLESGLALGLASTQCNGSYCVPGLSLDFQKAPMFPLVPLEGYPGPCAQPWATLLGNERAWGIETSSLSKSHATPAAASQLQPPSSSLWIYSQVPDQNCPSGPSQIASLQNHELNEWLF